MTVVALCARAPRVAPTMLVERLHTISLDPPSLRATLAVSGALANASAEWRIVLGWSPSELVGGTFLERIHPDDLDTAVRAIHEAYAGGITIRFSCRLAHKDGGYVRIHWAAAPRPDELDLDLTGAPARNHPPEPPT